MIDKLDAQSEPNCADYVPVAEGGRALLGALVLHEGTGRLEDGLGHSALTQVDLYVTRVHYHIHLNATLHDYTA